MRRSNILTLLALAATAWCSAAQSSRGDEVVIKIVGVGGASQYLKNGQPPQLNVEVFVGDTVKFVNDSNTPHTATADVIVEGAPLFKTDDIAAGAFKVIPFNDVLFNRARTAIGESPGGRVHVGYYCTRHPDSMGGKIVFKPASMRGQRKPSDH